MNYALYEPFYVKIFSFSVRFCQASNDVMTSLFCSWRCDFPSVDGVVWRYRRRKNNEKSGSPTCWRTQSALQPGDPSWEVGDTRSGVGDTHRITRLGRGRNFLLIFLHNFQYWLIFVAFLSLIWIAYYQSSRHDQVSWGLVRFALKFLTFPAADPRIKRGMGVW